MKKSKTNKVLKKWLIPVGIFIIVSAVYIYCLCPSIYPGDNPDVITAAATLGIPHPPGYPLFTILGHIFSKIPLMDIPWRINLMSALFSSLTVVFIYLIILKVTKKIFPALLGSLLLAFSFQYFSQALYADFLSLSLLFSSIEILILLFWLDTKKIKYLYLFSLIAGINFSSHQTSAFLLPAVFYLIYLKDKKFFLSWDFGKCIGFFILGLFPYIYLPIRAHQNPVYIWGDPGTLSGFIAVLLRKEYGGNDFSQIGYFYFRIWDFLFTLGWRQYYLIGLIIGVYGFIKLRINDKLLAYFLLLIVFFTGFVFAFFANASSVVGSAQYLERFFIISGTFFAIFIGIGAAEIENNYALPGYLLLIIPAIFLYFNYPKASKRNYYYAIDYARNIIQHLPENSFVFSVSDTPTFDLWYLQYVKGERKDLTISPGGDPSQYQLMKSMEKRIKDYSESINVIAQKRPVYTTTLNEGDWRNKIDNFVPQGLIYRYSQSKDWYKDYNSDEVRNYLLNYTFRGVYNTKLIIDKDNSTKEIVIAYADAWNEYGIGLYKQNKLKEASEAFITAMKFDPENEFAWTNLASVYYSSGNYKKAQEEYIKLLRIYPNSEKVRKGFDLTEEKLSTQ